MRLTKFGYPFKKHGTHRHSHPVSKRQDSFEDRYKRNLSISLARRVCGRVQKLAKSRKHSRKISEVLGCSIGDFRMYIESKFEAGMSWDNFGNGGWHLDHIMPCAIFDLENPAHFKRCFHFSNYQPMWATENLRKGCKVLSDQFQLL